MRLGLGLGLTIQMAGGGEPGGGGAPDWVPDGATDAVNFTSDQSWNGAEGTASDVVGGTIDSEGFFGAAEFVPENMSEEGYLVVSSPEMFAVLGDTLDRILAGATVVIEWYNPAAQANSVMIAVAGPDANSGVEMDIRNNGSTTDFFAYGLSSFNEVDSVSLVVRDAVNRVAINISSARFEFSLNGAAVEGFDLGPGDWSGLTYAVIGGGVGAKIRSFYALPLQDSAGLPALSA